MGHPLHPTFGINLQPVHPKYTQMVFRHRVGKKGEVVHPRVHPLGAVTTFVGAILDTMQNWADTSLATLKGYTDRVVEVRQTPDEGGMNLRMPPERILRLAHRGMLAGQELNTFDWDAHRITRYRLALTRLTDSLDHLRASWLATDNGAGSATFVTGCAGDGDSWLGKPAQRAADIAATQALAATIEAWRTSGYPLLATEWPKPAPDLRMSPR